MSSITCKSGCFTSFSDYQDKCSKDPDQKLRGDYTFGSLEYNYMRHSQLGLIIEAVKDPNKLSVYDELDQLPTYVAKIQKLVQYIKKTYNPPGTKNSSYLRHLHNSSLLIKQLVELIINPNSTEDIRTRAQYALQSLEKVEECLGGVNRKIASFLHTSDEKTKEKIKNLLKNYPLALKSPSSSTKPIQFPIKPHVLHRKIPKYGALTSQIEQISPIEQRELHDAFWRIKEVMYGYQVPRYFQASDAVEPYCRNLLQIGAREGFSINYKMEIEWLRDPLLIVNDKKILIPLPLKIHSSSVESSCKLNFTELTRRLTSDPNPNPMTMESVGYGDIAALDIEGEEISPFFFEGGNLLHAINQQGEEIYLCGASNILYSLLNARYFFLAEEKQKAVLEEMKKNAASYSPEKISLVQERLEKAELLSRFSTEEEKKYIAKVTLATIKIIEQIMQETLGHRICVVGEVFDFQPEFHIDMLLSPAPEGVVFLQDYELCCKVLKTIDEHYLLTNAEKNRHASYLENAKKRLNMHGNSLKLIAEQLRAAGFQVVPVPGIYYNGTERTCAVNFLNALIGKGEKGTFCITNGSSHSLDRYLRDAYTDILHSRGIDRVYFTGRQDKSNTVDDDPRNRFNAADHSLRRGGGIHCRTQKINGLFSELYFTSKDRRRRNDTSFEPDYVGEAIQEFYSKMLKMGLSSKDEG